jgi:hypothetical protein
MYKNANRFHSIHWRIRCHFRRLAVPWNPARSVADGAVPNGALHFVPKGQYMIVLRVCISLLSPVFFDKRHCYHILNACICFLDSFSFFLMNRLNNAIMEKNICVRFMMHS